MDDGDVCVAWRCERREKEGVELGFCVVSGALHCLVDGGGVKHT